MVKRYKINLEFEGSKDELNDLYDELSSLGCEEINDVELD